MSPSSQRARQRGHKKRVHFWKLRTLASADFDPSRLTERQQVAYFAAQAAANNDPRSALASSPFRLDRMLIQEEGAVRLCARNTNSPLAQSKSRSKDQDLVTPGNQPLPSSPLSSRKRKEVLLAEQKVLVEPTHNDDTCADSALVSHTTSTAQVKNEVASTVRCATPKKKCSTKRFKDSGKSDESSTLLFDRPPVSNDESGNQANMVSHDSLNPSDGSLSASQSTNSVPAVHHDEYSANNHSVDSAADHSTASLKCHNASVTLNTLTDTSATSAPENPFLLNKHALTLIAAACSDLAYSNDSLSTTAEIHEVQAPKQPKHGTRRKTKPSATSLHYTAATKGICEQIADNSLSVTNLTPAAHILSTAAIASLTDTSVFCNGYLSDLHKKALEFKLRSSALQKTISALEPHTRCDTLGIIVPRVAPLASEVVKQYSERSKTLLPLWEQIQLFQSSYNSTRAHNQRNAL